MYCLGGNAHDGADLLRHLLPAGNAGVGLRPFCHGLRISVAARISAGAAVCPGKDFPDLLRTLILLHRKDPGKYRQQHAGKESQPCKQQNRNQIFHAFSFLSGSAKEIFYDPAEAHEGSGDDPRCHQSRWNALEHLRHVRPVDPLPDAGE